MNHKKSLLKIFLYLFVFVATVVITYYIKK
jgi:hypothetical protein